MLPPVLTSSNRKIFVSATSKILVCRRGPVQKRLRNFDVLIPKQFVFRSGHSITNHLMRLVESIPDANCRGEQTIRYFFDMENAFLSVWHNEHFHKLREIQLPDLHLIVNQMPAIWQRGYLLRENRQLCLLRKR